MDEIRRFSRPFSVAAVLVAASGGGLLAYSVLRLPVSPSPQLALLLAAAILTENYALKLASFNISLAFPLLIAAIILGGPGAAGMVAAVGCTNFRELLARRPLQPLMFNFGQLVTAACVGGWSYIWSGGAVLWRADGFRALTAVHLPSTIGFALVAALVAYVVNITFMSCAVAGLHGEPPLNTARVMLGYMPTQLALVFVGVLIAQVLAVSWAAFPLFLFPLALARQIYQRYENLREVYLDTVRSLISALEAKDPYTRGHSERVAQYAKALGSHLGLDERALERLERAALLHDVGKLSLSEQVLTKPGALDDDELRMMRLHPDVGADMVSRIPPLRVLESTVRAHHERLDGSGYPAGLISDEIPLAAKILSVADAYDAMTTKRAYRDAMSRDRAVAELIACADVQFDGQLVRAFIESGSGRARVPSGSPVMADSDLSSTGVTP